MYKHTDVSIFVFALGAASHVTDGPDVPLLEAGLVVEDGDAVSLHHEGQRWKDTNLCWVTVVICILKKQTKEVRVSHNKTYFK